MADKNKPQVTKNSKTPEHGKAEALTPAATQLAAFEAGMRLFHARKLGEARAYFQQASAGPGSDVAQRAQLHRAMCDRRLDQPAVSFGSAEEYYNYGVALLNLRNPGEARAHLEKALSIDPGADHVHYALALAHAMTGDVAG